MIFLLPYRYYYEQELKKCFKFFYVAEKVISPQTVFIKSIPIYNCAVRRASYPNSWSGSAILRISLSQLIWMREFAVEFLG